MPFDQAKFATVGAHSADTPSIYSYSTSDSLPVVITTDYFKPKEFQLQEGDWIFALAGSCNAILQVQSDNSTALVSSIFVDSPAYAEYHLTTTPENVILNDDGVTYTPIPNMVINIASEFSLASNKLVYDGPTGRFLVNGTSDLEVNKAADVTYALVIDGVPVPTELTTIGFTAAGKKRNISITAIAEIVTGNVIEIWAKGDGTLGVVITVNKLDTTYVRIGNG